MGSRNPLIYLFGKVWRYSEGNRRAVAQSWTMFVVAELIEMFCHPFVMATIMNKIQSKGVVEDNLNALVGLLMLTLVLDLTFWAIHGPARCLEQNNAFQTRINYRTYLLQGVMTLPMDWHMEHHSGDTIDRIDKGARGLFSFAGGSFEVIYSIVQLIVSYAILAYFSPPSAVIVLGMLLVSMWITVRFDRVLVIQYQKLNRAENHITEGIFDTISNITTVITLRVEKLVFRAILQKIEQPFVLFRENRRLSEFKWFMTNMCCTVMTILVLGMYFWRHTRSGQVVMVGTLYLLLNYLDKVSTIFFRFTGMYSDMLQYQSQVTNAEELAKDFKAESFANHVLPKDWGQLQIRDLNFSYHQDGNGDLNLDDVSLDIERGQRIALVGVSGSGKTTLLKVMRDLFHPQRLTLSVDGRVIPDGFAGISRAIALIPQDPEIFATTIRDNITMGADHSPEFTQKFIEMACFADVVASLPRGLDSSIKEKGVNLSGGQQQRLALARGLAACDDKDIILLDEPTASLDVRTEGDVYSRIFAQFAGKTVISSIHRLHLLPLFDRICLFNGGRIIACGDLRELLSTSPEFQEMWRQYHLHHENS